MHNVRTATHNLKAGDRIVNAAGTREIVVRVGIFARNDGYNITLQPESDPIDEFYQQTRRYHRNDIWIVAR